MCGSECDGAVARFVRAPAGEVVRVESGWLDEERGGVSCKYSAAGDMGCRARVRAGETVLVTGARGSAGAAAIQL